jgi:antitoxin HicB
MAFMNWPKRRSDTLRQTDRAAKTIQPLAYPVLIEQAAPADFVAIFPDIPEAITGGESHEQALLLAEDALAVAIERYLDLGRPVPAASAHPDLPLVPLDPRLGARVLLSRAMAAQGLTKVALAALMRVDEKAVRLILSGRKVRQNRTLDALPAVSVRPALAV